MSADVIIKHRAALGDTDFQVPRTVAAPPCVLSLPKPHLLPFKQLLKNSLCRSPSGRACRPVPHQIPLRVSCALRREQLGLRMAPLLCGALGRLGPWDRPYQQQRRGKRRGLCLARADYRGDLVCSGSTRSTPLTHQA